MKRLLLLGLILGFPFNALAEENSWVLIDKAPKELREYFSDYSIDTDSFLLTEDGVTVYGLRSESDIKNYGRHFGATKWEGIDCQSSELVLSKPHPLFGTRRLPIKNPKKMTRKERNTDVYNSAKFWKKYKLVCNERNPKKITWKTSKQLFESKHPHQKRLYQFQLDQLGLTYKEAQEKYSSKCRSSDDYSACMKKFGI